MLITALSDHAVHLNLPPRFHRRRPVRWAILLDADGNCPAGRVGDLADEAHPHGPVRATPYTQRPGPKPPPMLADDTLEYVLAMPKNPSAKAKEDAAWKNSQYVRLLHEWLDAFPDDPVIRALCAFFDHGRHLRLHPGSASAENLVALRVEGTWADELPSARAFWAQTVRARKTHPNSADARCLSCMDKAPFLLSTLPDSVAPGMIPAGAGKARDAQLVSVNKQAQGRTGQKLQLATIPVCETCGSQAMSVLNTLLADPVHRRRGKDSVLVWWLRDPEDVPFMQTIDRPSPEKVAELHDSVHRPTSASLIRVTDENRFYALTLSANQSRVVVRDWLDIPVPALKKHLSDWFSDHSVIDPRHGKPRAAGLWELVLATGRWDAARGKYTPDSGFYGVDADLLLCALRGSPPPTSLLPHLLQRLRADGQIDLPRTALLRLILTHPPYKEHIMPDLDPDSTDPAYVWGRVFAVLEAIQRKALPQLNTTIQDRYFRTAMTQPSVTYPLLRSGANAHLGKLRRSEKTRGAWNALNRQLAETVALLPPRLPSRLDADSQARFAIGYDHQRADDMIQKHARIQQANGNTDEEQQ